MTRTPCLKRYLLVCNTLCHASANTLVAAIAPHVTRIHIRVSHRSCMYYTAPIACTSRASPAMLTNDHAQTQHDVFQATSSLCSD